MSIPNKKSWCQGGPREVRFRQVSLYYELLLFFKQNNGNKSYHNPNDFRTVFAAISSNFILFSLHVLAASTLAALSSLGSENK